MGGLHKLTAKDKDTGSDQQSHSSSSAGGAIEETAPSEKERAVDNASSEKTSSEKTNAEKTSPEVDPALPVVAEAETASGPDEALTLGEEGVEEDNSDLSASSTPVNENMSASASPAAVAILPSGDSESSVHGEEPQLLTEALSVHEEVVTAE